MGTFLENKVLKNQSFQTISYTKVESNILYRKKNLKDQVYFLMLKNDFESTNFANFEESVHIFGKSDDDMI